MRAFSIAVSAAVVLSLPKAVEATQQVETDRVLVTEVSADPTFVSGVLATAVKVSGTVAGAQRSYFIPFMTAGQAKPRVGNRCDIVWRWHSGFQWLLGNGEPLRKGRMVANFHCETESN